jgi:hypothetical protein
MTIRREVILLYSAIAAAASATGKNHAQSANRHTAAAAMMQPRSKPASRCIDLVSCSRSAAIKGWRLDSKSIKDRTEFDKLPVITALTGETLQAADGSAAT